MSFPDAIQNRIDFLTHHRESSDNEIHVTELGYCFTKNLLTNWLKQDEGIVEKLKEDVPLYIISAQFWHRALTGIMAGEGSIDFMTETLWPDRVRMKAGSYKGQDIYITGQADWLEENGTPVIGELKTTRGVSYVRKDGVSFQYELQGILYCKLYNINKVHWYFTDWYSDLFEVEEEYDDEIIDEIWEWSCKRAFDLYKARVDKVLIPHEIDFKDKEQGWQCAPYCPFTKFCHPSFPFKQKSHKGRKLHKGWRDRLIDPDIVSTVLYEQGVKIPDE